MKKYIAFITVLIIFSLIQFNPVSQTLNSEQSDESEEVVNEPDYYGALNEEKEPTVFGKLTDIPNNEEEQFAYFRNLILNELGVSLETYLAYDENSTRFIHKYIYALMGYEKGTLTREEAEAMTKHNTPTSWWGILLYPLEGDFRSRTDKLFKFYFFSKAGVPAGERIKQIDVYLDKDASVFSPFSESDSTVTHLKLEEEYDLWNFGYVSGKKWIANPGADGGIWGADGVGLYAYCNPGFLDNAVKVVIRYKWQTWGLFSGWTWENPVYNKYNRMIFPLIGPLISIDDDDSGMPVLVPFSKMTYIYDDNGNLIKNPLYIYDDEDFIGFGLRVWDDSGISDVSVKVDGIQIPTSQYWWERQDFLGSHQIWITLYIPGYFYGLGTHFVEVRVTDNDDDRSNDKMTSNPINFDFYVYDDDTTSPWININYHGGISGFIGTDENPGYWNVYAGDLQSGIDGRWIYVDGVLKPGNMGSYKYDVPNSLGEHTIQAFVKDNDYDRGDADRKQNQTAHTVIIIDDDITPPHINYVYTGDYTDGNPGEIIVTASDASGLFDNPSGTYTVLNNLGIQTFTFTAIDDDNDRPNDRLPNSRTIPIEIKDDDTNPPELSNLIITHNIHNVNISLTALDQSGISNFVIFVNGEEIIPLEQVQDGNTYKFTLGNQWISKNGLFAVDIQVTDTDNDRPNDALTSSISGTFEITLEDLYAYVNWQIAELKTYIDENVCWFLSRILNHKLCQAQKRLEEAYSLVECGKITCGLFHDKIAKIYLRITEFKIDILNWFNIINDEEAEFISNSIHSIRNNIVMLMGTSVGTEHGYDIALIEVDLLNLNDFIEEEINCWNRWCLRSRIRCATLMLEAAIFKISLDHDFECMLACAQHKLDMAECEVNRLLDKGKISQELADTLLLEINQAQANIEAVKPPPPDDDVTGPVITITHVGKGNEKEPGEWNITIEDLESGIDEVQILVDGNQYLHDQNLNGIESKHYEVSVPSRRGYHTVEVIAKNNDKDEPGDQETSTTSLTVRIKAWIPPLPPPEPPIPVP